MEAGIDDESGGAKQEGLKEAGAAERIVRINAELVGELLGIKRPAFRISGEEAQFSERRYVLRLLGDTDLEVVPGHAFVIAERGQRIFRPVAKILEVDEIDCRARAIERRSAIIAVRRAVLNLRWNAADLQRLVGQGRESVRQAAVHVLDAGI